MRRAELVLDLNANHRSLRRCHGCGNYSRPEGEVQGRLLCEKCFEKARRVALEGENDGEIRTEIGEIE